MKKQSIKPKKTILLFDIDRTLILSGGAGRIATERAFEEVFGVSGVWGSTQPDGKTDPAISHEIAGKILKRRLQPGEYRRLCRKYYEHFRREIPTSERFRLLPGVKKLLGRLSRRKDILLGLATGNFETTAWLKLRRGGLDHFFGFGGFASDSADRPTLTRKALLRGTRRLGGKAFCAGVYVIGDSFHDIRAGRKAGAKTIAVATGSADRSRLERERPDHLFDDLTDARRFLGVLEK